MRFQDILWVLLLLFLLKRVDGNSESEFTSTTEEPVRYKT